jgi:molecular chaperone DnaK
MLEKKSQALAEASASLAQQAGAQSAAGAGTAGEQASASGNAGKEDVLDAEFEEVKDKK